MLPSLLIIAERSYCSSFLDWKERIFFLLEILPNYPNTALQIRNKTALRRSEQYSLLKQVSPTPQIWLNGAMPTAKNFQRHLPEHDIEQAPQFFSIASSIHSPEALHKALPYRPLFLQYGAIFPTSKPVTPLGLDNLSTICKSSNVPIFAVGGINSIDRIKACKDAGALGVSIGSWIMQSDNMQQLLEQIQ